MVRLLITTNTKLLDKYRREWFPPHLRNRIFLKFLSVVRISHLCKRVEVHSSHVNKSWQSSLQLFTTKEVDFILFWSILDWNIYRIEYRKNYNVNAGSDIEVINSLDWWRSLEGGAMVAIKSGFNVEIAIKRGFNVEIAIKRGFNVKVGGWWLLLKVGCQYGDSFHLFCPLV